MPDDLLVPVSGDCTAEQLISDEDCNEDNLEIDQYWIWDWLPEEAQYVLEQLLGLLNGCAQVFVDTYELIRALLSTVWDLVTGTEEDRERILNEFLETIEAIGDLIEMMRDDPEAALEAILTVLGLTIDDIVENPGEFVGGILCEILLGVVTGGAAAGAGRVGRVLRSMDEIRDLFRRRQRVFPFPCRNGGVAAVSSFPAGTPVLMADGTYTPIEEVEPGDLVLAVDETTGTFNPRPVLAQWSVADRRPLATVTVDGGGSVTATADHRFWNVGDDGWLELAEIEPGDRLLTPDGPISVADLVVHPPAAGEVWELDVAVDDTFLVSTGTGDVVVHNANSLCDRAGEVLRREGLDDRLDTDAVVSAWERYARDNGIDPDDADAFERWLQNEYLPDIRDRLNDIDTADPDPAFNDLGIPPARILDAWNRYKRDNPDAEFRTWYNQYRNVQKNRDIGGAAEIAAQGEFGFEKNHTMIRGENGEDFIPDGLETVRPADPDAGIPAVYNMTEVKELGPTNPLDAGSNAAAMADYVAANGGSLRLVVGPETRATGPMIDKLRAADGTGEVTIFRSDGNGGFTEITIDQFEAGPGD